MSDSDTSNATLQLALIFTASFVGAGAISYVRGRQGMEIVQDTFLHGMLAGTGITMVSWAAVHSGLSLQALANPGGHDGMGNTPKAAMALLEQVDDALYEPVNVDGLILAGPMPTNPSIVNQKA